VTTAVRDLLPRTKLGILFELGRIIEETWVGEYCLFPMTTRMLLRCRPRRHDLIAYPLGHDGHFRIVDGSSHESFH